MKPPDSTSNFPQEKKRIMRSVNAPLAKTSQLDGPCKCILQINDCGGFLPFKCEVADLMNTIHILAWNP